MIRTELNANGLIAILYESIDEAGAPPEEWRNPRNAAKWEDTFWKDSSSHGGPEQWLGAPSRDEFDDRLRRGWIEGAERLRQMAAKEIKPQSLKRRLTRGDEGDELDMQAVYAGTLDRAWSRSQRKARQATREIAIVCNLACVWTEHADTLFWRGAAALKLSDALTQAGYNVAIYAATGVTAANYAEDVDVAQFMSVKRGDEPLDVTALASIVAMIGFKRTRFHCGTVAAVDSLGLSVAMNLGLPSDSTIAAGARELPIPQNAVMQPQINSRDHAERWIDEAMAQIEAAQQQE